MLSTSKTTILDQKYETPGLDQLLKHERWLRKLWQETRDPACKTTVNWVTQNIRRMFQKRTPGRLETQLANCKVTPQAIWLIAKPFTKRGGPKAPSAVHGALGPVFHPFDNANIIAECLENHDLCNCDHRQSGCSSRSPAGYCQ
jgi:hypothetical protein